MWGYHEGMSWWWIFGGVWMFVIWTSIIGLVVWVIKQLTAERREGITSKEPPMEIAQNRLARGEITTEQFEGLRDSLRQ